MPVSLHSHSGQFCKHATGTLEAVVQTAIEQGFISYGLSEHMPRDRVADLYPEESGMDPSELVEQFDRFIVEACRLKQQHSSTIPLLIGLETELIEPTDTFALLDRTLARHQASLDYLVGSVHHVNQIPIDFDRPMFEQAVNSVCKADSQSSSQPPSLESLYRLCETYFEAQHMLIERYHPEVIGHFDLCLLFNPDLDLQSEPAIWGQLEENIKLAISYGALFEVNSASLRKGWSTPYPSPTILKLIISLGGRLTLSDDSHGPDRVGLNYYKMLEYLRSFDVQTLWYLGPAEETTCLLPRKKVSPLKIPGLWWEHPFWTDHSKPATEISQAVSNHNESDIAPIQPLSCPLHSIQLVDLTSNQDHDTKLASNRKLRWKQFSIERFTYHKWFILSTSLPFWKNKKNVTITYSVRDNEPPNVLDDLVEYHPRLTDDPKSVRKRIVGVDRPINRNDQDSDDLVEWRWRGKGLLRCLESDWQLLGYNFSSEGSEPTSDTSWVITFFQRTLFTPAGIDIYSQNPSSLSSELKAKLIQALRDHPSQVVSTLADSMFDIPHDL